MGCVAFQSLIFDCVVASVRGGGMFFPIPRDALENVLVRIADSRIAPSLIVRVFRAHGTEGEVVGDAS